jgi:hypothetical protein
MYVHWIINFISMIFKCIYKGAQKYMHIAPQQFFSTVLFFDTVAQAFICVAPSLERTSHYTPYITFRFNLKIFVDKFYLICIHFLGPCEFRVSVTSVRRLRMRNVMSTGHQAQDDSRRLDSDFDDAQVPGAVITLVAFLKWLIFTRMQRAQTCDGPQKIYTQFNRGRLWKFSS